MEGIFHNFISRSADDLSSLSKLLFPETLPCTINLLKPDILLSGRLIDHIFSRKGYKRQVLSGSLLLQVCWNRLERMLSSMVVSPVYSRKDISCSRYVDGYVSIKYIGLNFVCFTRCSGISIMKPEETLVRSLDIEDEGVGTVWANFSS